MRQRRLGRDGAGDEQRSDGGRSRPNDPLTAYLPKWVHEWSCSCAVVIPRTYPTYRRQRVISYVNDSSVDLLRRDAGALLDRATGRVIVGLTGPPGAGKSTVAQALVEAVGDAAYLPMDGFHRSNADLDRLGRRDRKGAIDTFDAAGYVAALRAVRAGYRRQAVSAPGFDRGRDEPVPARHVIPAECLLLVTEGNYLGVPEGEWAAVRGLLDKLYYVDCPSSIRRKRLVARHIGGGRTPEAAAAWADNVDQANAALIATTRQYCDFVIDGC